MNTPIYAHSGVTGIKSLGTVGYTKHSHSSSMLPPSYAGSRWDAFTPWDTQNEKREKKRQEEEAEERYQEQLAMIASSQPVVNKPSPVIYVVLGLIAAGTFYMLSKK